MGSAQSPGDEPPGPAAGEAADDLGAAPLSSAVERVLRSLGRGAPGAASAMVTLAGRWDEVAGRLSARCRPAELTSDGVLVVIVDDPAFVPELRFSGSTIVAGAAALLGEGVVHRVDVRVRR